VAAATRKKVRRSRAFRCAAFVVVRGRKMLKALQQAVSEMIRPTRNRRIRVSQCIKRKTTMQSTAGTRLRQLRRGVQHDKDAARAVGTSWSEAARALL
jgi:hypothetical protein